MPAGDTRTFWCYAFRQLLPPSLSPMRLAPYGLLVVLAIFLTPSQTFAQTDEIQVYDGSLADVGVFNLTLHTNFTPDGQKTPAFPGGVSADKSLNQVPEWAYGVTPWFEAGLYLPLYTRDRNLGWGLDGAKIRLLFAVPHADDRKFFFGSNFECSYNARRWDSTRFTSEIRPIIGWHLKPVDIIVNPIFDTAYDGFGNLEFVPAARVAYNFSSLWAAGVEEYADIGPVHKFNPLTDQTHQLYGIVDYTGSLNVEVGVGFGLTSRTDHLTFKLILSRDLNKPRSRPTPISN
jgi:hypothetical protein